MDSEPSGCPGLEQVEGLIETRGLRKSFLRDGKPFIAVGDVTLSVQEGCFLTVVGPSGCGKSTLLQMVAGLTTPTGGRMSFAGEPVTEPPFEMIYVFQQYTKSLMPWRTVVDNVAFGLELPRRRDGRTKSEIYRRCIEALARVGLEGVQNQYPSQLSGGMQQRVAIARALVCRPAVLLMDEPFSALDALSRASLQDLLLELWGELDLTIVFVTHDIEEAVYLSDRVAVLSNAPSQVVDMVDIDLPRPRRQVETKESPAFLEHRRSLYQQVLAG